MTPNASRTLLATGLEYELLSWAPADPSCQHTLLFLHGYLDLAHGWLPVMETGRFARYHVLAPSLRGHGRSDWIGKGATYYFLDYIADVRSLIDRHAREKLSIIGHSMGGMISAYFTGTYPERVSKLALLEGLSVPEFPTSPARLRIAVSERLAALGKRGKQEAPGSRTFPSLDDAVRRMQHHDPRLDLSVARRLCAEGCVQLPSGEWVFRHDPLLVPTSPIGFELPMAERFWGEVRCDLLYLEGSESPMKLGGEQRARRVGAFKQARSRHELELPGAGHMMIRHAASETAAILDDFLTAPSD